MEGRHQGQGLLKVKKSAVELCKTENSDDISRLFKLKQQYPIYKEIPLAVVDAALTATWIDPEGLPASCEIAWVHVNKRYDLLPDKAAFSKASRLLGLWPCS